MPAYEPLSNLRDFGLSLQAWIEALGVAKAEPTASSDSSGLGHSPDFKTPSGTLPVLKGAHLPHWTFGDVPEIKVNTL
jgi:hypothetical protein